MKPRFLLLFFVKSNTIENLDKNGEKKCEYSIPQIDDAFVGVLRDIRGFDRHSWEEKLRRARPIRSASLRERSERRHVAAFSHK